MFEPLDRLIGLSDGVQPEKAKRLVRLSTISIVVAAAWISGASPVAKGPITWVPALAFALIAVVALTAAVIGTLTSSQSAIADAVAQGQRAVLDAVTQLRRPTPAGYHLGCRVGRLRLECGLLHVTEETTALPEADQVATVHPPTDVVSKSAKRGHFGHDELFEKLGQALQLQIQRADAQRLPLTSIGIAIPGGMVPERGSMHGALVQGVPVEAGETVAQNIASDLIKNCGMDTLRRVFQIKDADSLMKIIHLDNDARCAARWLITDRGPQWNDFACVFAGTGVGSGLVFDRHIFYGAEFRAGEVGHVELNTGDELKLGGTVLKHRACSCGKEGYHFEALVGIGGLGHLATVLDSTKLAAIRALHVQDRRREAALAGLDPDEQSGQLLLHVLRGADNTVRRAVNNDPDLQKYLKDLMGLYGQLFGVGISAILNALDLPHVALCGPIPDFLQGNVTFTGPFQAYLSTHVMGGIPDCKYGDMRKWAWRGAALLPRDPDYLKRRFP